MGHLKRSFAAVVLAADRRSPDPVAQHAGSACKSLAPVGGREMLLRVLDVLKAGEQFRAIVICGPPEPAIQQCPELQSRIASGEITWVESRESPSLSAEAALAGIDADTPVLLTTADHPLLRVEMVDYFLERSLQSGADVAVGLAEIERVHARFPGARRTVLRMREGGLCSCNLFAFLNERGRAIVSHWRRVEQQRKHPLRLVAGLLGVDAMAFYLLRRLSLAGALRRLSKRLRMRIEAVVLPFAEAAVDVDTPEDLALARSCFEVLPADRGVHE